MSHLSGKLTSDYFNAANRLKRINYQLIRVYVEGYDDIPFWREVFDEFETQDRKFEINVPVRSDLAKGKRVVLNMSNQAGKNLLLCVDSDFDYIFGDHTEQSRLVNKLPYVFHTYAYSIENLICYSEGLHSVCVKATKNDANIFDFVEFMSAYSEKIYNLFLWYAMSALQKNESFFTLIEFRNAVKIGFLDLHDNGAETLRWVERQTQRKLQKLSSEYPDMIDDVENFRVEIEQLYGVTPQTCYLYIQGHTLMDNIVMTLLKSVCNYLKDMSLTVINKSDRRGQSLKNEMSNYTNSLKSIHDILMSHSGFRSCPLYANLRGDIQKYLED